jgi:hypothetical protein
MTYNILLFGAGNIGSRHIQGFIKTNLKLNIHIVDPNPRAINITKERILEIKKIKNKKFFFYKNINFKKKNFNLLVMSTSSKNRLTHLKKICFVKKIDNLLIEKIAFQNFQEYLKAIKLLEQKKIKNWVNCARNAQPIYKYLRNKIKLNEKLIIYVRGNSWNLASNAIHFIDLFYFLLQKKSKFKEISTNQIKIIPSKRFGYLEVTGKVKLINSNFDQIILEDKTTNRKNILVVKIINGKQEFIINESLLNAKLKFDNKVLNKKIKILKQSELSKLYIQKIFDKKSIELPSLIDSLNSNDILFKLFYKIFKNQKKEKLKNTYSVT